MTSSVVPDVAEVLEEPSNDAPAENFLLVGSDTRENIDPNDPNAAVYGDSGEVVGPAQRHDHDPAARTQWRRACCSACRATSGCRSPDAAASTDRINSAYNDGADVLARTITDGLGHPDQPLRRGRLRRLPAARGRHRRRRDLRRLRDAGPQLRAAPQPRLPDPRRRAGAWPTPAAATTRSSATATGRPTLAPTSAASSASRTSSALAVAKLLQQVQSNPFALNGLLDVVTESLLDRRVDRPAPGSRRPEGGDRGGRPADLRAAGRRRRDRRQVRRRAGRRRRGRSWTSSVASAPPPAATRATTVPG